MSLKKYDKAFVIVPKTETERQIYFIRQRYWDGVSKSFYLNKSIKDISNLDVPSFGHNGSLLGMRRNNGWNDVLAVRQGSYVYNLGRLNHVYRSEKTRGELSWSMKGVVNAESALEKLVMLFDTDGYKGYKLICLNGNVTVYRAGLSICSDRFEYMDPVLYGFDIGLLEEETAFLEIHDKQSHYVAKLSLVDRNKRRYYEV